MKNYIRYALCTLFVWLLAQPFYAQTQDTETGYTSDESTQTTGAVWTELGATKVLPYNLSLGLDVGFRSNDWFNEASRWDIGLGLSWKPTKHWKFGVGYTLLFKHYPQEVGTKNETEISSYSYKNTSNGDEDSFKPTTFPGATYDDDEEEAFHTAADGTKYRYLGYKERYKDYTRTTHAYWRAKHRISFDAAYTYKFWKWLRVSLRERYQLTFVPSKTVNRTRTGTKTDTEYTSPEYEALTPSDLEALARGDMDAWSKITYEDSDSEAPKDAYEESVKEKSSKTLHTLRSRLTLEVDKKGWRWTPYLYVETFNDMDMSNNFHLDKLRLSAGVDYALSGSHKLSLGYVFNHENDDDGDLNIHAICVGYKFKF